MKRANYLYWAYIFFLIFSISVLLYKIDKIENEIDDSEILIEENYIEKEAVHYAALEKISFFEISDEDREIINAIVAGESKGESIKGKKLVAQCIMNAMIRNNWDAETVRVEYKYAGWEPELKNNNPELWSEIEFAVNDVFDNGNIETYEPILYFYNPDVGYSNFHEENLDYVLTEGNHRFFKLKGE